MSKIVNESLSILILAVLVSFLVNILRPNGIDIQFDPPEIEYASDDRFEMVFQPGEPLLVSTGQVEQLLKSNRAIALDARTEDEFIIGHLPQAMNLPYESFYEYIASLDTIDNELWLITYCGGPPCDLGELLGMELAGLGYKIAIYQEGLDAWQETGLQVQTGRGGLE